MSQVQKYNMKDYWSTDPTVTTPIFSRTMNRSCFKAIWQAWHFKDNSQLKMIHLDSSKLNMSIFRSSDRCTVLDKNSNWMKE
jgi:hypothetical protein